MVKNQFKEIDGNTYYFNKDGYKQTGYLYQGNDCYYFDSNGVMQKIILMAMHILEKMEIQ